MGYKDWLDYDAQVATIAKEEKAAETALRMLGDGLDAETVAKYVDMPIWWIEKIKNEGSKKEAII